MNGKAPQVVISIAVYYTTPNVIGGNINLFKVGSPKNV